ncbi:MAG: PAS-domain containing protein [Alphaproteobacteria bacterium]|nr:PAS-domain containing protein [Alphaproteobacteria bacterium]
MSVSAQLAEDEAGLPVASLWEVFNRLPNGVCLLDGDERFVACNEHYRDLLGPAAIRLVVGTPFRSIVAATIELGVVEGGETPGNPCVRGTDWITERIEALRAADRTVVVRFTDGREMRVDQAQLGRNRLITLTDVTVLRQQERALAARVNELEEMQSRLEAQSTQLGELAERLATLRDEAERANRTKSEFLANMSHELRSPLNAIIGFSEIMKDQLFGSLGSAQYREYAFDIWMSGRHLLDLINDILDLSKIEAGKLDLVETRFDLGATIAACMRIVAGRAEQAEVAVRSTVGADGIVLWADERKIKQILINLLTNAIKFTKPGGRVKVAVAEREGWLEIEIADTGIGIAASDIPVAFAAFGQVDSSLARKHEGTGLGLPLSKALTEMHGGRLLLESELGIGTTVRVGLPVSRIIGRLPSAAA